MSTTRIRRAARRRFTASVPEFLNCRKATVAVEFGFVALPFLAIIVALFQIGVVYVAQQELETAVEQSGRLVLTGQAQSQGLTQQQFQQAVCGNLPALFNCAGVMVDMQTAQNFAAANTGAPQITFDKQGKVNNQWQFAPGAAGSVVVLRVMYLWPMVSGPMNLNLANVSNGTRLLMATAVFKNEP